MSPSGRLISHRTVLSGDGGDEPPVAGVDALEGVLGRTRDPEGVTLRGPHDPNVVDTCTDRLQDLVRRQAIGLPTEPGERAPLGDERPELWHPPQASDD